MTTINGGDPNVPNAGVFGCTPIAYRVFTAFPDRTDGFQTCAPLNEVSWIEFRFVSTHRWSADTIGFVTDLYGPGDSPLEGHCVDAIAAEANPDLVDHCVFVDLEIEPGADPFEGQ